MDKDFVMNSSIPPQLQYDQLQSLANSMEIQTTQSQAYFISTPPQIDHFESTLGSMVSSPTASNSAMLTDNFMIRELIGKLDNINNYNGMPSFIRSSHCSANNSCYCTPLSSPPKLGIIDHMIQENFPSLGDSMGLSSNIPSMLGDPGLDERAARFSSLGSTSFNGGSTNRKRKAASSKGKGKEIEPLSQIPTNSIKVGENGCDYSNAKRSRSEKINSKKGGAVKAKENKGQDDNKKLIEPPKDYIHVRARRGQATDSHSLAERVRREKISERMKLLQDIVPGCNRVTGKALILDEIINYVQSLQRQVEFLSMKLSTVNPRLELNMNNLFLEDEIQPNCSLSHPMYPTMVQTLQGQPHQNPSQDSLTTAGTMDPLNRTLNYNHVLRLRSIQGISN